MRQSQSSLLHRMSMGVFGQAAEKRKLVTDKTGKYHPPIHNWGTRIGDLPAFTQQTARSMLIDPAIRLGLAMRAAPIFGVEFAHKEGEEWVDGVLADSDEVKAYVERQIKRIWRYVEHFLSAQVWGWASGEVTYKLDSKTGLVEIDKLLPRHAIDSRAIITNGELSGVRILQITDTGYVDLDFPKCWWHAFQPEAGQLYGQPILTGAYSPWWDKWMDGGGLAVRRLFMHKDAYGGTDMTYPEGSTMISDTEIVPNRDIARQLAEQVVAGGVTARPAKYDEHGNEQWQMTRATVPANPAHILQYPKDLDVEIWRGMDIADDVLSSDSTGAWAGKRVPMAAFYAGLDRWVISIVRDITTQILEPLVELNFGPDHKFDVPHKPLAEQAMEQQGETTANQQPTQPEPQQPSRQPEPQQRMSLDPVEAVGQGVLNAAELVKAARKVMRLSSERARAPKDGVNVGGTFYAGGEFIPSDVMDGATEQEKTAIAGDVQSPSTQPQADSASNAAEQKAAKSQAKFDELMKSKTPADASAFRAARADGKSIPPAWTEVIYYGADKDIIAVGRDSKGRKQRSEKPEYRQRISDANNERISRDLIPRIDEVRDKLRDAAIAGSEEAKVLYLLAQTGFRIGGPGDGKAEVKAFGGSSLTGDHVTVDGDTVAFDFPGKSGVRQQHTITDPVIADMMRDAKLGKPIFSTRADKIRTEWKQNYGGAKVHDIRHVVATETALTALAGLVPPPPKSKEERDSIIKQVSIAASDTLGNNPSQALHTYIDPHIFDTVRVAA